MANFKIVIVDRPAQGVPVDAEALGQRSLRRERVARAVQRADLRFQLPLNLSVNGLASAALDHLASRYLDIWRQSRHGS